jgi:hypothetical protein
VVSKPYLAEISAFARLRPTTAAASVAPDSGAMPLDFGLLDPLKQAQARLTNALQQFAERLGESLKKAINDASSLEVSTYVSNNMAGVTYNSATGQFSGSAQFRALTRIAIDGDMQVVVPEHEGGIDQTVLPENLYLLKHLTFVRLAGMVRWRVEAITSSGSTIRCASACHAWYAKRCRFPRSSPITLALLSCLFAITT